MFDMYSDKSFEFVRVVVFDPMRANMLITRTILHGIGFRSIEGITDFKSFVNRINSSNEIGLCLIEAGENTDEVQAMIRSLRQGETPANPFLPVVGTLWQPQADKVAQLMNAGFDDVLVRPFSVAKGQERVRALVNARKPFVITSDYVGPDRGSQGNGRANTELVDVPNVLKSLTGGDRASPLEISEELTEARYMLHKRRLAKLARRIAMAAEVTIQAVESATSETAYVLDLLDSTQRLVSAARKLGNDEVSDISVVLEQVVGKVAMPGPDRAENAELTRQLALALYVSYAVDDGEKFRAELDEVMTKVRRRLNRLRERSRWREELTSVAIGQ